GFRVGRGKRCGFPPRTPMRCGGVGAGGPPLIFMEKEVAMFTRHVGAGLAFAGLLMTAGCCHPFCKRPAATPAIVSSSPVCCPPGGPAPGEPAAVAAPAPPPPVQSFAYPAPATGAI